MWSTFESLVSGHDSFSSRFSPLVVCSCDVTSAEPTVEPDCASVSGQAQIRPAIHIEIITLPRRYAGQMSMRQEPHPVRRVRFEQRATSTLEIGRRIMAQRRRSRRGRGRRYWARSRANDGGRRGNGADESLRAFVRALARQAARECFELELKQRPRTIQ
jgi:hypothetical protein